MPVTFVPVSISDATTYTVLSENSGLMHYFPDFTSTCTATLPSPKAGLWFEFTYSGVAADAQNFVISSGSDTNYFVGGLTFIDHDTDVVAPVFPDGNSNSKLTLVTPAAGTVLRIESANGTTWIVSGFAASATVPTFADQ
jgi:hypothetical protein